MKTTRLYYVTTEMKTVANKLNVDCLYTGGGLDYFGLETDFITYYLVNEEGENDIPRTLDEKSKIAFYDERDDSNGFSFEGTALECLEWISKIK